jgi:hypothetical protein
MTIEGPPSLPEGSILDHPELLWCSSEWVSCWRFAGADQIGARSLLLGIVQDQEKEARALEAIAGQGPPLSEFYRRK